MISYKPLFKTLEKRNINMTEMRKRTGIATATMAKLKKNESITLEMINKICKGLNCEIEDIVEIEPDNDVDDINYDDICLISKGYQLFNINRTDLAKSIGISKAFISKMIYDCKIPKRYRQILKQKLDDRIVEAKLFIYEYENMYGSQTLSKGGDINENNYRK